MLLQSWKAHNCRKQKMRKDRSFSLPNFVCFAAVGFDVDAAAAAAAADDDDDEDASCSKQLGVA